MSLTEATWAEVTAWFDQLADLDAGQRARALAGRSLPDEVRRLLDQLLNAHDAPEPLLVDRTVDAIAGRLLGDQDAPPPADWVGRRLGHWRVVRELQRGGMATVVLAERDDGHYERRVALKVLHATRSASGHRDALEREIKLLAGLAHPGIVHLLDGGVSDEGWPYLVMEFVEGEPIDAWCDRHGADLETRIGLLRQVAAAVAHAHGRLVVHADLKPGNVLIDADGRARLVDFGIGRLLGNGAEAPLRPGLRCSPAWASPEQLRGEPASVASDVYGLGMLAWRLLTGHPPRSARAATRALTGQPLDATPGRPSDDPEPAFPAHRLRGDLDAICVRATAADPEQRYPSAEAFERDLRAWAEGRPVAARAGGARYRLGKWLGRHRLAVTVGSLALLAVLAGSATAVWQAVRAQAEAERATQQAQRAETIKTFLLAMFTAADPWLAGGGELDIRDVLAQGRRQAETDETLDPATRTEVLTTLGDVQVALGWHDEARAMFERAEAELDAHPELPDELRARLWLERAVLAGVDADYRAELDALDRARTWLPPPDGPDAVRLHARVWAEYASIHARENRAEDAEAAFRELDALFQRTADPMNDIRLRLLSTRAVLAFNQGKLEAAYAAANAERALQLEMHNAGHPTMVRTLSNLAAVAAQLGRLDEALQHDREAATLARQVYPAGHPSIARALYALGDTLRQRGGYDEALQLLDEARSIQHEAGQTIDTALTDLVRARTLLALGRGREAAEWVRSARSVLEAAWGPNTRTSIQALDFELQGSVLADDRAAVEATIRTARERLDALESPTRWQPLAQMLRWRLARIHHEASESDAARALLDEAGSAPDDIATHPSVTLRLLGLERLLADRPTAASAERILSLVESQAANDDARAFALCALLRTADDPPQRLDLEQRLATLAESKTLSHEGRIDAACSARTGDRSR